MSQNRPLIYSFLPQRNAVSTWWSTPSSSFLKQIYFSAKRNKDFESISLGFQQLQSTDWWESGRYGSDTCFLLTGRLSDPFLHVNYSGRSDGLFPLRIAKQKSMAVNILFPVWVTKESNHEWKLSDLTPTPPPSPQESRTLHHRFRQMRWFCSLSDGHVFT